MSSLKWPLIRPIGHLLPEGEGRLRVKASVRMR